MADFEGLALGATPDDHAPASVQVDADVLLGLHLGPPSSWSDWFRNPEFSTRLSMTRVDLVAFDATLRRHRMPSRCSACRPEYSPIRSHGSGQALLHHISLPDATVAVSRCKERAVPHRVHTDGVGSKGNRRRKPRRPQTAAVPRRESWRVGQPPVWWLAPAVIIAGLLRLSVSLLGKFVRRVRSLFERPKGRSAQRH